MPPPHQAWPGTSSCRSRSRSLGRGWILRGWTSLSICSTEILSVQFRDYIMVWYWLCMCAMYLRLWLNSHLSTCDDASRTVGRTFQEDGAKSIWQVENASLNWGWRSMKMAFTVFQEIHSASSAWKTKQSWFLPSNPPISSSCLRRTSDDPWTGYWTYGRIYLSYICDTTIHIYTIDTNHLQGMFLHVLHLPPSILHSLPPSTAAPLKRRRTRPSMPRGLRQAGFMRLKRSAWNRVNFLVRFLGWQLVTVQ